MKTNNAFVLFVAAPVAAAGILGAAAMGLASAANASTGSDDCSTAASKSASPTCKIFSLTGLSCGWGMADDPRRAVPRTGERPGGAHGRAGSVVTVNWGVSRGLQARTSGPIGRFPTPFRAGARAGPAPAVCDADATHASAPTQHCMLQLHGARGLPS